jgi:hypothetical protein
LYGPLLVVEPGQTLDTTTDRVMLVRRAGPLPEAPVLLNGRVAPAPLDFRVGARYRLRFINIMPSNPLVVSLLRDSAVVSWRAVGKDGADLRPAQATLRSA